MYTAITTPNQYMFAMSPIPFRGYEDNILDNTRFRYITNLLTDVIDITSFQLETNINGYQNTTLVGTLVTTDGNHDFAIGDRVFLTTDSGSYDGGYTILDVPQTNQFIIISVTGIPSSETGGKAGLNVTYKNSPDLDGEVKLDVSNIVKDMVTTNFDDNDDIRDASETRTDYEIYAGFKSIYQYDFDDNYYSNGNVGFWKSGVTIDDVLLEVGDAITVSQDLTSWEFTNSFAQQPSSYPFGDIRFEGADNCYIELPVINPLIYPLTAVNGQPQSVFLELDAGATNTFGSGYITPTFTWNNTNPFDTDFPTDIVYIRGGQNQTLEASGTGRLYGYANINYNGQATILNIYEASAYGENGVVIEVDKPFGYSTPAIGGKITSTKTDQEKYYTLDTISGRTAYYGSQDIYEYELTGATDYVMSTTGVCKFSTVLDSDKTYGTYPETKGWALLHGESSFSGLSSGGVVMSFNYNDGTNLDAAVLWFTGITEEDIYIPTGVDQWKNNPNVVPPVLYTLDEMVDMISNGKGYYEVTVFDIGPTLRTEPLKYYIEDCSQFDMYNVCWRDRLGSYISLPFALIATEEIEVSRSEYYTDRSGFKDDNTYGFNSYDRGSKNFFVKGKTKWTLNSGWMKDHESRLIEDLMLSPEVFIQMPDGQMRAVVITENNKEIKKQNNYDLYNYEIKLKESLNKTRY